MSKTAFISMVLFVLIPARNLTSVRTTFIISGSVSVSSDSL